MNKKIGQGLQAITLILVKLSSTANALQGERFSVDALDKAGERFQKLSLENDDWVDEWDIEKVIKNVPHRTGAFIRSELDLLISSNEAKYYYYKTDLLALAKELKDQNINLKRYSKLLADEEKFRKILDSVSVNSKSTNGKKFSIL